MFRIGAVNVFIYDWSFKYSIQRFKRSTSSWNSPSPLLHWWQIWPLNLLELWQWSTTHIPALPPVPINSFSFLLHMGQA